MQPAQLRIGAEPARLLIKSGQYAVHRGACDAQVARRPDRDPGAGAQRVAIGDADDLVAGRHQLPPRGSSFPGHRDRHQSSSCAATFRTWVTTVLQLTVRVVVVVTPDALVVATECVTRGAFAP